MKRKPKFLRVSRRTSYADRYRNMKRKTNIREFSTRRTPYAKRYMKAEPMFLRVLFHEEVNKMILYYKTSSTEN